VIIAIGVMRSWRGCANSLLPFIKRALLCSLKWTSLLPFHWGITMAKVNLSNMTVDSLMELRQRVDKALLERRAELEKQLARMDKTVAIPGGERDGRRRRGTSALRGRKIAPKYRGPSGETWAGRGAKPRWLVNAIKEGKKPNDFLIDKSETKKRQRARSKR
jgi:DNA-binding protein H-NS